MKWVGDDGKPRDGARIITPMPAPRIMPAEPKTKQVSVCSKCGDEGQTGKFCVLCGKEIVLAAKCEKCGCLVTNEAAKFCPKCGSSLT